MSAGWYCLSKEVLIVRVPERLDQFMARIRFAPRGNWSNLGEPSVSLQTNYKMESAGINQLAVLFCCRRRFPVAHVPAPCYNFANVRY